MPCLGVAHPMCHVLTRGGMAHPMCHVLKAGFGMVSLSFFDHFSVGQQRLTDIHIDQTKYLNASALKPEFPGLNPPKNTRSRALKNL